MSNNISELDTLREQATTRAFVDDALANLFAPEDQALREAREAPSRHDMPSIEISPLQGRLLQVLALACGGEPLRAQDSEDSVTAAVASYDRRAASDPRLLSVGIAMDEGGLDGFAISVVRSSQEEKEV
jgi:hypothetical protein